MEPRIFFAQLRQHVDNLDSVAIDSNLDTMPEWDSLAVLSCIAFVDSEYSVRISGEDLRRCQTLTDVHELVSTRSGIESSPA